MIVSKFKEKLKQIFCQVVLDRQPKKISYLTLSDQLELISWQNLKGTEQEYDCIILRLYSSVKNNEKLITGLPKCLESSFFLEG